MLKKPSGGPDNQKKREWIFFNAFGKRGSLVFNYLWHGGEDGLSAERIWETWRQNLSNQSQISL
jgi:hypothetical protein